MWSIIATTQTKNGQLKGVNMPYVDKNKHKENCKKYNLEHKDELPSELKGIKTEEL